jgi:epoxyqueuosine reductase QueG
MVKGTVRHSRIEGAIDTVIDNLDRHAVGQFLRARGIEAWGVAANDPPLPLAPALPRAVSVLMRIDPGVLRGMRHGPTEDYRDEYLRLNRSLDAATAALAGMLRDHGREATPVPATGSESDGLFPHKTAATSAGLGWIGKTALFVSPDFGSAVRLATLFTDLDLPVGEPITDGRCGACRACVDACPAGCGRDVDWRAGMARDDLFDASACRHHMQGYTDVEPQICGICIAACPLSRKD